MMLMDEEFTASLRAAKTPEEFLQIIDQADEEKKSVDERLAVKKGDEVTLTFEGADEDAAYEAVSKFMQETLEEVL